MPPKKDKAAEEDYSSWPAAKLKDKLKELGASTTGNKDSLAERLTALAAVEASQPKRGGAKAKAAAEEKAPPPKRGAAKAKAAAAEEEPAPPPPKRGAAKAKAAAAEEELAPPPPKRGAAKAKADAAEEEPAPLPLKRGAAKATAAAVEEEPAPPPPKRGAAKAKAAPAEEEPAAPPPKRGAAKAKAAAEEEPPPKRGAAKAKASAGAAEEPAAPKRGAPKAKATAAADSEEPPAKKAKAEAKGKAKASPAEPKESATSSASGPSQVYYEDGQFSAEYAKSNRSKCKKCMEAIEMGGLRIGKQMPSDKFDGMYTVWQHLSCFLQAGLLPRTTQLIAGFSTLRPEDQETIAQRVPACAEGGAGGVLENDSEALKEQNLKYYEIQDALSQLSDNQLREMLELNDYPSRKLGDKTATLKELCADGIMFGAAARCQLCSGSLLLSGEGYRCKGWISEFLKCTFKTQKPERVEWKLTQAAKQAVKGKLGTKALATGDRLFAAELRDDDEVAASQGGDQKKPPFLGLTFVVLERGDTLSKEKLEELIKANGGSVADTVARGTTCVVSYAEIAPEPEDPDEEPEDNEVVAEAKQLSVPGAGEDFITASIEAGELVDMTPHLLWGEARRQKKIEEAKTSTFIEKMGVSMDSDVGELADTAHVLVDRSKKCVYSEMLTKTDLVSGGNSYYTLHLLESDAPAKGGKPNYWVFRKWGRIGVSQGGTKLQEFGTGIDSAIAEFKKQYLDKTGNAFGHGPKDFKVASGKFVRVEMEHKALSNKKAPAQGEGTAEAAASGGGGEKGGNDQPLGKLSKAQIEKGDAVLDKVEALLNVQATAAGDEVAKAKAKGDFLALSAEFYTLIPHNFGAKRPPPINTAELLGAEKALLQFYLRMGFEEIGGEEEEKLTPIGGVMQLPLPSTLSEAASMVCGNKDIKSCTTKGSAMHKKKAGKPQKPMSPDLYGAILLYTSNAIYKELNKALRDEDRSTVEKFFPYLRLLFEACARLPQQKRTLWRGVGVDLFTQYKVGSTIIWWGVSSCTSDEAVARNFMAGCGDGATMLTVETLTACDISEVSFFANEAESILLPGTQLEVVASSKAGKKSEITLREVGRVVN